MKGIEFVTPVVRRVLQSGKYPEAAFIFAGKGDARFEAELYDLAHEFPERVGFKCGFITDIYYHFYCAGSLFDSFSKSEPGGIAPMEALAFGVPCLVSDKQGHKSTIRTIFIPEFAQEFGITDDEPDYNGARFVVDDYSAQKTVDNIMVTIDRVYRIWENRHSDNKWQQMRINAVMSNNDWSNTVDKTRSLI